MKLSAFVRILTLPPYGLPRPRSARLLIGPLHARNALCRPIRSRALRWWCQDILCCGWDSLPPVADGSLLDTIEANGVGCASVGVNERAAGLLIRENRGPVHEVGGG